MFNIDECLKIIAQVVPLHEKRAGLRTEGCIHSSLLGRKLFSQEYKNFKLVFRKIIFKGITLEK